MPHGKTRAHWLVADVHPNINENPADLSPEAIEFGTAPYRHYVTDYLCEVRAEGKPQPSNREAFDVAKSRYEEDLKTGVFRAPVVPPMFRPDSGIHRDVVYYARMDRLVKIGTTHRIKDRMAVIMPQGVLALEWGDRDVERRRHNQFVNSHSHGEWFRLTADLWEHIADARVRFEAEVGVSVEEWLERYQVPVRSVRVDPIEDQAVTGNDTHGATRNTHSGELQ